MWLLLAPTLLEGDFLEGEAFTFLGRRGLRGKGFVFLETGIGKVNAALTFAAYAACRPVERALLFGFAGAYPGAPLALGEAALVAEEVEADLGLRAGLKPLGFPALRVGETPYYNRFPLDPHLTGALAEALGLRQVVGLTRDLVSESPEEAQALARLHGAALENMEGAAFARAALALGVPGAELRAISNPAGLRDRRAWRMGAAKETLARLLVRILAL